VTQGDFHSGSEQACIAPLQENYSTSVFNGKEQFEESAESTCSLPSL